MRNRRFLSISNEVSAYIVRAVLILSVLGSLSACGFALRGSSDSATIIPDDWKRLHLSTGNTNSEFSRVLMATFATNGVEWSQRSDANYILVLSPEKFKQRNLSLSSEARAAEFELSLSAVFSVRSAGDPNTMPDATHEAMAETTATVIKQMENDPRNVVGKAEEIRLLRAEMRRELAQQIMRRISFFAASRQTSRQISRESSNALEDTEASKGN